MFTTKYWKDLTERVVSSAALGALAVLLGGNATGDHRVGWTAVLMGAGVAGLGSFLKCLAASRVGKPDSASLVE